MSATNNLWDVDEIKRRYGKFFGKGARLKLERRNVPEDFWPLLHYAAFWGAPDDSVRETLVLDAPPDVLRNLKQVVAAYDSALDEWLAGPEADAADPTMEYVAFSAMRMAAYFA